MSHTMFPYEIWLDYILPHVEDEDVLSFSYTCKHYSGTINNERLWKSKQGMGTEKYLGKRIPVYKGGDIVGNIRFNHVTEEVFPKGEFIAVLVSNLTPLYKVEFGMVTRVFKYDTEIYHKDYNQVKRAVILEDDIFPIVKYKAFGCVGNIVKSYREMVKSLLTCWENKYPIYGECDEFNFRVIERHGVSHLRYLKKDELYSFISKLDIVVNHDVSYSKLVRCVMDRIKELGHML